MRCREKEWTTRIVHITSQKPASLRPIRASAFGFAQTSDLVGIPLEWQSRHFPLFFSVMLKAA